MKRCLSLIFLLVYVSICVQLAFGLSQGEKLPGLQLWEERMNVARKYLLPRWEEAIAIANQYVPDIINRVAHIGEIEFVKVASVPLPEYFLPSDFELPYEVPTNLRKMVAVRREELMKDEHLSSELYRKWIKGEISTDEFLREYNRRSLTEHDLEIREELLHIEEGYYPAYVYQNVPIWIKF
ncbi:MAG: hypothetical protein ACP5QS_07210, partial [bacterium]